MSKEKEDRCIELLENLLAKYPESLEELLDFLINAEQFYRENKEYIENRDYILNLKS